MKIIQDIENDQKDDIPLPDYNERKDLNIETSNEEQKNELEDDSDLQYQNTLNFNQKNILDYKSQTICELVYSEEPYNDKNKFISYDKLLDIINIKELYSKNKNKSFVCKNFNPNNEIFFSSNFESGNLRYAIKHNEFEYDLILRPETGSLRTYQWFYFMIHINNKCDNLDKFLEKPIIKFNIINLCKKSLILNNKIKVLSYYNKQWSRDTNDVYYYKNDLPYLIDTNTTINNNDDANTSINNENNNNNKSYNFYTLTFTFDLRKVNTNPKYVYFSYSYPYTYTRLTTFLSSLNNYKNILRFDKIGYTIDGNKIYMIIITDFNDNFDVLANKKAIILTARVHPGESNSSIIIQALIEYLLSNDKKVDYLRKNFIFKIIPMLNPDGVIRGNFRMNSVGKDLNRMWMDENLDNSPSVFYTHKMIQKTLNSRQIFFFCDFHGHSNKYNYFLYSCKSKADFIKISNNTFVPNLTKKRYTYTELIFQEIYSKENKIFDINSCINKIFPSKIRTARAILKNKYNIDLSYCLEASLGGIKLDNNEIIPFTIKDYQKIGIDFITSLYKLIIPKIYFSIYNTVRMNINKVNLDTTNNYDNNNNNNKRMKGKSLLLPAINTNNIITHLKAKIINLTKNRNDRNNNFNQISLKNRVVTKLNYGKVKTEKNKIINGFFSPKKSKLGINFKLK